MRHQERRASAQDAKRAVARTTTGRSLKTSLWSEKTRWTDNRITKGPPDRQSVPQGLWGVLTDGRGRTRGPGRWFMVTKTKSAGKGRHPAVRVVTCSSSHRTRSVP